MKVIIAGTRTFDDYEYLCDVIRLSKFEITEVVHGGAKGVDSLAERYAYDNELLLKKFPANWKDYGRAAGPTRNYEMARYGDALIAIMVNGSPGTKNMIMYAKQRGLKTFIVEINSGDDD